MTVTINRHRTGCFFAKFKDTPQNHITLSFAMCKEEFQISDMDQTGFEMYQRRKLWRNCAII